MSSGVSYVSKDGDLTCSLGQCWNVLALKTFFLFLNISSIPVCACCLLSSDWTPVRSQSLFSLFPPIGYLCTWIWFPWAFSSPGSLGLFLYDRCSSPLIYSTVLHWTLSSVVHVCFILGSPNWTQHSKCVSQRLSRGERKITSIDLLATLFLMQPGRPLASCAANACYWLMVSLVLTRTPRSLYSKSLFRCLTPACTHAWCKSSPGAGLTFPPVERAC